MDILRSYEQDFCCTMRVHPQFPLNPPCKGILIQESGKFLLVECGILDFGIQNTALGIRNPTND